MKTVHKNPHMFKVKQVVYSSTYHKGLISRQEDAQLHSNQEQGKHRVCRGARATPLAGTSPAVGQVRAVRVRERAWKTRLRQGLCGLPCGRLKHRLRHTAQQFHLAKFIDNVIKNEYCSDYPYSRISLLTGNTHYFHSTYHIKVTKGFF